jgi:type IV pilus assembly protein PilF
VIRPREMPFLSLVCLFAAILAGCAGNSANRKQEADARMRMGVTYLDQRNLPMAMQELTKASELDPENAEVEMVLGLTYQARGDLSKAEEHLRRAISMKSDYAEARNNLGIVLAERKEWDKANAEGAYRRALRANDRYAPAYIALSGVLGGQGRWADAASVLTRCVEVLPDYSPGWMALGRAWLRLSRPEDALKAFDKVLTVSSDPEERKQAASYVTLLGPGKR